MTAATPDAMHHDTAPQGSARHFIVLLALLQGLLLYVASTGAESGWWPFSSLGGRVYWYTLVLTVPTVMMLSLVRLTDPRLWQHAIGLFAVFSALAAWAVWTATGVPEVDSAKVLTPFGCTVALAAFIATPYLQARLAHGRWCAPYARLFQDAWQNTLTLVLAGVFVALGWGLLHLWAALFKLVGIDFFHTLFRARPFTYLATGSLFGLGVLIGRTQFRAIFTARSVLFALFKGLLPVLSLVALMFVLTLPFTGLAEMWAGEARAFRRVSVATVLAFLVAHQVLFLNAVFQDGTAAPPYPRWLRRIVQAALVAMPVFALLGLSALGMRIAQYGWTPDRFWALVAVCVLLLYAAGYAFAVFRRQGRWLQDLPRINIAVSLVILVVVVLGNSPVLDPHRLSANSQLARLQAVPHADLAQRDIDVLRFEFGRHGVRALQTLRADVEAAGDEDTLGRIDHALARSTRYSFRPMRVADTIPLELGQLHQPTDAAGPIPAGLIEAMRERNDLVTSCALAPSQCWVLALDLDFDGHEEQLVCSLGNSHLVLCWAFARTDQGWSYLSSLRWYQDVDAVARSIRQGRVEVRRPRWSEIVPAGGRAMMVQPEQE